MSGSIRVQKARRGKSNQFTTGFTRCWSSGFLEYVLCTMAKATEMAAMLENTPTQMPQVKTLVTLMKSLLGAGYLMKLQWLKWRLWVCQWNRPCLVFQTLSV